LNYKIPKKNNFSFLKISIKTLPTAKLINQLIGWPPKRHARSSSARPPTAFCSAHLAPQDSRVLAEEEDVLEQREEALWPASPPPPSSSKALRRRWVK
jgi:hypothetical protein